MAHTKGRISDSSRLRHFLICLTPLQQAILRHYRLPEEGEGEALTAQTMFTVVARHHPTLLAGVRLADFGRQVARLFPMVKRQKTGRTYLAVPMKPSAAA